VTWQTSFLQKGVDGAGRSIFSSHVTSLLCLIMTEFKVITVVLRRTRLLYIVVRPMTGHHDSITNRDDPSLALSKSRDLLWQDHH